MIKLVLWLLPYYYVKSKSVWSFYAKNSAIYEKTDKSKYWLLNYQDFLRQLWVEKKAHDEPPSAKSIFLCNILLFNIDLPNWPMHLTTGKPQQIFKKHLKCITMIFNISPLSKGAPQFIVKINIFILVGTLLLAFCHCKKYLK